GPPGRSPCPAGLYCRRRIAASVGCRRGSPLPRNRVCSPGVSMTPISPPPHNAPTRPDPWPTARRVLVCCHDAGGAEILSDWVLAYPDRNYLFLVEGPARKIFSRKLSNPEFLAREEAYGR